MKYEKHNDRIDKPALVRRMFAQIAPKYDLLNHLLSLNSDKRWRKALVGKILDSLKSPESMTLDLCCGTADLTIDISAHSQVIGVDFCHPMLVLASEKLKERGFPIILVEGDAMRSPFPSSTFDVVTIAFGLRNLIDIRGGLEEIYRLLKSGGEAAILEFSRVRVPLLSKVFKFYFKNILPGIGNVISGSSFAYRYLHDSVDEFPDQENLASLMREVGFLGVSYYNLFGGVAAVHTGKKG